MQFQPYLMFDGHCAEAMRFYERVLGGSLEAMMTFADAPGGCEGIAAGSPERIMHACLSLEGSRLMASDTMDGQPDEGLKGFALTLIYPSVDDARRVFEALGEGGRVQMPMQRTFWVEAFGVVVDRFGTPWMVNGGEMTRP